MTNTENKYRIRENLEEAQALLECVLEARKIGGFCGPALSIPRLLAVRMAHTYIKVALQPGRVLQSEVSKTEEEAENTTDTGKWKAKAAELSEELESLAKKLNAAVERWLKPE